MYLGYSLFSVALLHWYSAAHDLGTVEDISSSVTAAGIDRLGYPLLYALFALGFTGAVIDRPIDASSEIAGEAPSPEEVRA